MLSLSRRDSGPATLYPGDVPQSMLPCNFNHLYYFYRVAVHESVSKASKELLIAQSALSTQLKQLEESLEVTLFNRTKGGMALTDKGQLVFKFAQQMFEKHEEMRRAMALAETEVRGPLRIGSVNSVGIYLLPGMLTEFHKKFTDVQIHLEMRSSNEVIELLQDNEVDLALIAWDRRYPQLTSEIIMQNELLLVGHSRHALARKRTIRAGDLSGQKLLGYEAGTPTRITVDNALKAAGVAPDYVLESANIATIKHLAIEGMGLAFLPEIAVEGEIRDKILRVIEVEGFRLERPITLYWKERRALPRPAEKFIDFLREWAGNLQSQPAREA